MDWPTLVARYDLGRTVTGILHCGAHLAEEAPDYDQLGCAVWWIEGNPELIPEIEAALAPYPHQAVIGALLSAEDDEELVLHISGPDYRGSSSVLEWGTHRTFSPLHTVKDIPLRTRTIDSLVAEHGIEGVNMVCTDLQGVDLRVLRGAAELLESVQFVMSEVNTDRVYVGCDLFGDWLEYLTGFGFVEAERHMVGNQGWGDCLVWKPS
jgi:FkbM family methyltransferase